MAKIEAECAGARRLDWQSRFRNVGNLCRVGVGLVCLLIPAERNFCESEASARDLLKVSATHSSKSAAQPDCKEIKLTGEVAAGAEWNAPVGQGWVFRLVPIAPSGKGYTGWDLVVDRVSQQGYPDALLLGTPPYGSLNEREIGTTFGLRAQDAIAWQPRRFHFLASAADLERGRNLYRILMGSGDGAEGKAARDKAAGELLRMVAAPGRLGSGEFTVLDAKLTGGTKDPPIFAQQWAMHLSQIPHTLVPSGQSGAAGGERGELRWIRFAVALRMPAEWKTFPGSAATAAKCTE